MIGIMMVILALQAPAPATGYFSAGEAPDAKRIAAIAPVAGDARDTVDRGIFRATRSLQNSPRWEMARSDDNLAIPSMLSSFSCSSGMALSPQSTPLLTTLVTRMFRDTIGAVNTVRELYPERKRPFLVEEGPICIPRDSRALNVSDYPSGHAAQGWALGLILSELAPDRATDILIRAKAFGDSRVICGVHNASAVEAGRLVAETQVAALHANAVFRDDLEAARKEIALLRSGQQAGSAAQCVAEAQTLSKPSY